MKFILIYIWLKDHAGTAILLKPGIILGGSLSHECPLSRSVGYYLEPIAMLAPFAKKPFELTLHGITTDDKDLSVRHIPCVGLGCDPSNYLGGFD